MLNDIELVTRSNADVVCNIVPPSFVHFDYTLIPVHTHRPISIFLPRPLGSSATKSTNGEYPIAVI